MQSVTQSVAAVVSQSRQSAIKKMIDKAVQQLFNATQEIDRSPKLLFSTLLLSLYNDSLLAV